MDNRFTRPNTASIKVWLVAYGGAIVAVGAATLLRFALAPLVGPAVPFITYFIAILFVVWYTGFGPAVFSILLSVAAGTYFFVSPASTSPFWVATAGDRASVAGFVLGSAGASFLLHLQRRTFQRLETEADRRRTAESAEREHRRRLETTLSSIGDAVVSTDAHGRVVFANQVALSLLRASADQIVGKHFDHVFRIVDEFTRQRVESPVGKVLQQGTVMGLANHTLLVRQDGSEIPIEESGAAIRGESGPAQGAVMVFRDVTERRRAEAADRLLASIVESSEDSIISIDLNGMITSWNRGAERIFGSPARETLGQPLSVLAPPDRVDEMPGIMERISRGERVEYYETVRRANPGRLVHVSLSVSPVYDAGGRITGASEIARDITERKQVEQALRLSEERYRATFDNAAVGIAHVGLGGQWLRFNDAVCAITGYSRDELSAKTFGDITHPDDLRADWALARRVAAGEIPTYSMEKRYIRKDGSTVWVNLTVSLLRDASGAPQHYVSVIEDITERKLAEDALQRSAEHLRISNEALARSNSDLERFAFVASHDLQEPLRMITIYAQLLIKNYRGQFDPEAAVFVANIVDGTHRMRELLTDLLNYVEIGSGAKEETEVIDLNLVLDRVQHNLSASIQESGATVTSDPLPAVRAHGAHFTSLLQNLIGNAIKYRSATLPKIHVSVQSSSEGVRFSIADNGIGIDPQYHDQIFEVFKRLHGKKIPGTGVGLAICQRIVERYGGRIWVQSQLGRGATFFFTLPAAIVCA